MRIRTLSVLSALVATALVACDGAPDIAAPALQADAGNASVAGLEASATGSGHLHYSDNSIRAFAISAVKHADGSVSGQYQLTLAPLRFFQDLGIAPPIILAHGTVTCMTVVGNSAYIGGTVDSGENLDLVVGTDLSGVAIELIDNGNGSSADADQISSAAFYGPGSVGSPQTYCDDPAPGTVFPIQQGNITVR